MVANHSLDGTYSKPDGESSSYVGSCATKNFIDQWDSAMRTATTNYIQAQISAFDAHTDGWIFWNFKTEVGRCCIFKQQLLMCLNRPVPNGTSSASSTMVSGHKVALEQELMDNA